MKKLDIAICGAMLVLCGCGPELAQVNCGAEEADWSRNISNSYPGYKAPRMAPPAIADNVSPRLVKEEEDRKAQPQDEVSTAEAKEAPATEEPTAVADAPAAEPVAQEIPQDQKPVDAEVQDPNPINAEAEAPKSTDKLSEQPADSSLKPETEDGTQAKPAAEEIAPAQIGEFEIYEVRPGDTLGSIAKKFYGSAKQYDVIMRANKIEDPKLIRIGTKLSIPKL